MMGWLASICFAVVIQEEKERIIIGALDEIEKALMGREADVYYDEVRPVGTFLIEMDGGEPQKREREIERWSEMIENYCDAIEKRSPRQPGYPKLELPRKKYEENAEVIFREKFDEDSAVSKYVALKLRELYQREKEKKWSIRDPEFLHRCGGFLIYPLLKRTDNIIEVYGDGQLTRESGLFKRTLHFPLRDAEIRVVYPNDRVGVSYAYVQGSLLSVLPFYADKLAGQKWHVSRCGCCGSLFLAKNIKKAFCSVNCEKENAKENRQRRRQEKDVLELERLINRENRYWDYRLNKVQQGAVEAALLEEMMLARKNFREMQKGKNRSFKEGRLTLSALDDWYRRQRDTIDEILNRNNGGY